MYLTTRGRRSGLPREIEIWYTHRDGRFYLIAEYPTSQWVKNVRAHPEVKVRVNGQGFAAKARIPSQDLEPALLKEIQSLSQQKYGWGNGLVVELVPETSNVELPIAQASRQDDRR